MVNKRGWLRIVEVSIAILMIFGVLIVIYSSGNTKTRKDLSSMIPQILEEIAKNNTLREKIIQEYDTSKPVDDSINSAIISEINNSISLKIKQPSLGHNIRICLPDELCPLNSNTYSGIEGDIYASERILSSSLRDFNPKKIKVFLWRSK